MEFYNLDKKEVYEILNSSENGLSSLEAEKRLKEFGKNELEEKNKISPLKIFFSQFNNFIVMILIAAMIVSIFIGIEEGSFDEIVDAIVIGIVLILNAILGFIQEYKAEKSIESLKKLSALKANVIRDGKKQIIDASLLVKGDIILLEPGSKVPADARLIESYSLETVESSLTGESTPVKKDSRTLLQKKEIADQSNMVFASTSVVNGRAKAIVTSTGMDTEIGKIAKLIEQEREEPTPLQKQLETLGKYIGIVTIIICFIVFFIGAYINKNLIEAFIFAIALAVAAVPEGLPAVVTISLALGVRRMVKKNALVRKLTSVETLGCTTVICSDKTGTLTMNQMTVKKIYVNKKIIDVSGSGYSSEGEFTFENKKANISDIEFLLKIGVLNNNSGIEKENIIGDPTEVALLLSAKKAGLDIEKITSENKRIDEIPFSSEKKMMSVIVSNSNKKIMYSKGAPEVIVSKCSHILINKKIIKLTKKNKEEIISVNHLFASQAMRVLAFAYKPMKKDTPNEKLEQGLIFVGLQAMIDPPRQEAKEAIEKCRAAGIKVVMITGDHEITAKTIASQLGIEGKLISGKELDTLNSLDDIVEDISIYARVNPEHKLKIVEALQKKGHVVAMTGDGVNDAPALKKADIGIAMGITGTDVAKEASDMVLIDDNFASIVNAVEEGRGIYQNIKKFVSYLISSNLGEVFLIFFALILGLPSPLIAVQILWLNLVTDGLPALALSVDPTPKDAMQNKPRKSSEKILNKKSILRIFLISFIIMAGTLYLFHKTDPTYEEKDLMYAQTIAFSTIVIFELFNVLNFRSEDKSFFSREGFSNKWVFIAILSSLFLQLIVIYTPLNKVFGTIPLSLKDWFLIIAVSSSVLIIIEIVKLINRFFEKNNQKIKS